eukprot:gene10943-13402_t
MNIAQFKNLQISDKNNNNSQDFEELFDNNNNNIEKDHPGEHYVLIDILHHARTNINLPREINKYMISHDSFDPRRGFNYPSDLLEKFESDTLMKRRKKLGVSSDYYEFWKVKSTNFSSQDFGQFLSTLPCNPQAE